MNIKMILTVALCGIISTMHAAQKAHVCSWTDLNQKKREIFVRVLQEGESGKSCWFSKSDKYHDLEKNVYSLVLTGSQRLKSVITLQGECLTNVMRAIARRDLVCIGTIIPGKKEIAWSFNSTIDAKVSQERAREYFKRQCAGSINYPSTEMTNVKIDSSEALLLKSDTEGSLSIPSILNPFGSLRICDKNAEILIDIDQDLAEDLSDLSLLIHKTIPEHSFFVISHGDEKQRKSLFLDRSMIKEINLYFSKLKWRNRSILGFSVAGIIALLAYFKLQQE